MKESLATTSSELVAVRAELQAAQDRIGEQKQLIEDMKQSAVEKMMAWPQGKPSADEYETRLAESAAATALLQEGITSRDRQVDNLRDRVREMEIDLIAAQERAMEAEEALTNTEQELTASQLMLKMAAGDEQPMQEANDKIAELEQFLVASKEENEEQQKIAQQAAAKVQQLEKELEKQRASSTVAAEATKALQNRILDKDTLINGLRAKQSNADAALGAAKAEVEESTAALEAFKIKTYTVSGQVMRRLRRLIKCGPEIEDIMERVGLDQLFFRDLKALHRGEPNNNKIENEQRSTRQNGGPGWEDDSADSDNEIVLLADLLDLPGRSRRRNSSSGGAKGADHKTLDEGQGSGDELLSKLKSATEENQGLQVQIRALQADLDSQASHLTNLQVELEAQTAEADQLRESLKTDGAIAAIKTANAAINKQKDKDHATEIATKDASMAKLNATNTVLREEIAALKTKLDDTKKRMKMVMGDSGDSSEQSGDLRFLVNPRDGEKCPPWVNFSTKAGDLLREDWKPPHRHLHCYWCGKQYGYHGSEDEELKKLAAINDQKLVDLKKKEANVQRLLGELNAFKLGTAVVQDFKGGYLEGHAMPAKDSEDVCKRLADTERELSALQ